MSFHLPAGIGEFSIPKIISGAKKAISSIYSKISLLYDTFVHLQENSSANSSHLITVLLSHAHWNIRYRFPDTSCGMKCYNESIENANNTMADTRFLTSHESRLDKLINNINLAKPSQLKKSKKANTLKIICFINLI